MKIFKPEKLFQKLKENITLRSLLATFELTNIFGGAGTRRKIS